MLKREFIAAIADLRDDEQIRVKVGDDDYLPVAVQIEQLGWAHFPDGTTRRNYHAVIYINEDDIDELAATDRRID
jgi:hypothetical protein